MCIGVLILYKWMVMYVCVYIHIQYSRVTAILYALWLDTYMYCMCHDI